MVEVQRDAPRVDKCKYPTGVECLNRTILEMIRTMMHESDLPRNLWPFVVQYTQEIVNRLPMRALSENKTSYEAFYLKKLSVKNLQIFGC